MTQSHRRLLIMHSSEIGNRRILIVGHTTEIYGPVHALVNYCRKNITEFASILHPLPYSQVLNSEYRTFFDGKCEKTISKRNFKFSELFSYLQHILLTFYFVLKNKKRFDVCVGADNLNAFTGIVLRKLGIVKKVIFYVIDYTPKRFTNPVINFFYHLLDKLCVRHSDYIWNISERIAKIREKQGVKKGKNLVVPVGIEPEKVGHALKKKNDKNVLVFVGHLTKSKGVELIIEAMENVVKEVPCVRLEIVGTGPLEQELKERVRVRGLNEYVRFLGIMDHDKLMEYLPTCGIALAPYLDDPNSITYFADPTKPKEYLACGLPVVITRVPWIAEEIEKKPMGIVINYDRKELADAIIKLLRDDGFYEKCKKNAIEFTVGLSWDKIFNKAFSGI